MKSTRVAPRQAAEDDIARAIDFYFEEGGAGVALRFVDALEAAFRHIGAHPATGSPRYAMELDLPGLRCWPVKRFQHVIFYIEHADYVDVWRVLHAQRDIPASLCAAH